MSVFDAYRKAAEETEDAFVCVDAAVMQHFADLGEMARTKQPEALAMFERLGVVFDRWPAPVNMSPAYGESWTPERFAALDDVRRWQGIAFTLYTELCDFAQTARWIAEADAEIGR